MLRDQQTLAPCAFRRLAAKFPLEALLKNDFWAGVIGYCLNFGAAYSFGVLMMLLSRFCLGFRLTASALCRVLRIEMSVW